VSAVADQLLSLAAAATRSGVSERTLRRQLKNPQSGLRASRIGRRRLVSATDLEVWLKQRIEAPARELPTDILGVFSPAARELLEWSICARKCAQAPNLANSHG
jgi:excisionase family DNA binding protein